MRSPANLLFPALTALAFSTLLSATPASAQTLFTVDGAPVDKAEFLKAYKKNNTHETTTAASYKDYLELYIRYKLKVRAAYAMRLDTLATQRTELQNFRSQVSEPYMTDEETMGRLVNEAFARGQKDIHLAHIFISIPKNATPRDTLRAFETAMEAYGVLKKKRGFGETAVAYSEDPSAKTNHGDLGYITVFTLPYELENHAYALEPGQYSKPFRSRAGYHIFKNLGERKAIGKIRVAQILLTLPPGTTEAARGAIRLRADSIWKSLQQGADFGKLAKTYSGDNLSYQNAGELPVFGVGKYDSLFETMAFSLTKNGEISKPFLTDYGYHILRRIDHIPFPHQLTKETAAALRTDVLADPRMEVVRKAMIEKIHRQARFSPSLYPVTDLWGFTDSAARNRGLSSYHNLDYQTILFTLGGQGHTIKEWLDYLQNLRSSRPGLLSGKSDTELFEQWERTVSLEFYRNHLEDYNKEFAFQLNEFREGNLLFEIMQRKIWERASADNSGLRSYYDAHKDKYWWEASADAVIFTCNNEQTANSLRIRIAADPPNWKKWADSAGAAVQADSGRFELTQIPVPPSEIAFEVGKLTSVTRNMTDNTISFCYILNLYKDRQPRNYKDARGFVINDYQVWLEDQWVAELRKEYPVKVNEAVLASLPK